MDGHFHLAINGLLTMLSKTMQQTRLLSSEFLYKLVIRQITKPAFKLICTEIASKWQNYVNISRKDSAVHSKIHLIVAFHKYSDLELPADNRLSKSWNEHQTDSSSIR
jgi:hypothetical protein